MLTWPAELPNPDAGAFRVFFIPVTQRSAMGAGKVRTRRMAVTAPTRVECQWEFSGAQYRLFRDFYRRALRQGADAFLFPTPIDADYHTHQVLFLEEPETVYIDPGHWLVSGKLGIQQDYGRSLWYDLSWHDLDRLDGDQDGVISTASPRVTPIILGRLVQPFRLSRLDIFIRVPPNSGTTDTLDMGWKGPSLSFPTVLVDGLDISSGVGHIAITPGHPNAGAYLGELPPLSELEDITLQWNSTGTAPTECDVCVIAPYAEE